MRARVALQPVLLAIFNQGCNRSITRRSALVYVLNGKDSKDWVEEKMVLGVWTELSSLFILFILCTDDSTIGLVWEPFRKFTRGSPETVLRDCRRHMLNTLCDLACCVFIVDI